jgi:hypothetical protein
MKIGGSSCVDGAKSGDSLLYPRGAEAMQRFREERCAPWDREGSPHFSRYFL